MSVFLYLKSLLADEDGAVTVDWVVLTAVIVTLGIAVIALLTPALTSTTSEIAASIDAVIT